MVNLSEKNTGVAEVVGRISKGFEVYQGDSQCNGKEMVYLAHSEL